MLERFFYWTEGVRDRAGWLVPTHFPCGPAGLTHWPAAPHGVPASRWPLRRALQLLQVAAVEFTAIQKLPTAHSQRAQEPKCRTHHSLARQRRDWLKLNECVESGAHRRGSHGRGSPCGLRRLHGGISLTLGGGAMGEVLPAGCGGFMAAMLWL